MPAPAALMMASISCSSMLISRALSLAIEGMLFDALANLLCCSTYSSQCSLPLLRKALHGTDRAEWEEYIAPFDELHQLPDVG